MKLRISIALLLCLSAWSGYARTADTTEKAPSVIMAFYTDFCKLIGGEGIVSEAEAALFAKFLTPGLIAKVQRIREENFYDPIIRAQDFDEKSLPTLTVTHVHGDWYAVSYFALYDRKCVVIPVKAAEIDGRVRISDIAIQ